MAAEDPPPDEVTVPPYIWEDGHSPNDDDMKLLLDVAEQLEKNSTGKFRQRVVVCQPDLFDRGSVLGDIFLDIMVMLLGGCRMSCLELRPWTVLEMVGIATSPVAFLFPLPLPSTLYISFAVLPLVPVDIGFL